MTLSSGKTSENLSQDEIRRKRLERLAALESKTAEPLPTQQTASTSTSTATPAGEADPVLLTELITMGFENEIASNALIATNNQSLDVAVDYIVSHPAEAKETETQTKPVFKPIYNIFLIYFFI